MFLTLDEYLTGASKLLSLYGYNCHKKDEDAISFVASYMMKADQTWDGHSSSRDTWRFNQARFAIMKLKTKYRNRKKLVSLNTVINHKGNRDVILSDVIEDRNNYETIENFNEIMYRAKQNLSSKQFECLSLHYVDGMTLDKIGDKLGITKQAVSLHIIKAVQKLKNECRSQINYITS